MATARGLLSTVAGIKTPCSVKAKGKVRRPPRPAFDISNCDVKPSRSSGVSEKRRSPGKRSRLRFICFIQAERLICRLALRGAASILALNEAARCHFFHFTGVDLRGRGFGDGH